MLAEVSVPALFLQQRVLKNLLNQKGNVCLISGLVNSLPGTRS